jgi:hypothetical protein
MRMIVAVAALVSSVLCGCGGTASQAVDVGVSPPMDASSDAPPCNNLELPSMGVTIQAGTGDAPPAAGGPIADGTYLLTSSTDFNAGDGIAGRPTAAVMVFSGGTITAVVGDAKGGVDRFNATYLTAGTSMMETGSCGLTDSVTQNYTATGTTLTLIQAAPAITSTFTRM